MELHMPGSMAMGVACWWGMLITRSAGDSADKATRQVTCAAVAGGGGGGSQADEGPGNWYPHACLGEPADPEVPPMITPPDADLSCFTVPVKQLPR